MLYDPHDLYNRRRFISDPSITRGTGDPGSYEGHQNFYRELQKKLQERIEDFKKDCDEDNDPWGYGMEIGWDIAQEYSVTPVPEKPLPKDPNRLLEIVEGLGAFVKDGVLWVDENVAPAVLTTLELIALLLSIPLRFFTERAV
ncbi:MAG: hypothetical protein MJA27_06585 [Pseudanabaenales cyanobacterium]|nr:hypothetical protein [Pseudanabaenales cyanobacterium]